MPHGRDERAESKQGISGVTGPPIEAATMADLLGARRVSEIDAQARPPLLAGRMDPLGHTVLYGMGGVGKGALASAWIAQLVIGGGRVLIVDYENHPDEWARRLRGLGIGMEDLDKVLHVAPHSHRWSGPIGGLSEHADALSRLVVEEHLTLMVVDSLVAACRDDPMKPETAGAYAAAVGRVGVPTLSLGHIGKDGARDFPFGSVFWHNLARVTWLLEQKGGVHRLTNRKDNNQSLAKPTRISFAWDAGSLVGVTERDWEDDLAERIAMTVVSCGPATVAEICDALNVRVEDVEANGVRPSAVARSLQRHSKGPRARFSRVAMVGREAVWNVTGDVADR